MRTLFKRTNPDVDAYLQREERARARRLEAFAIEALELGLAFEDGAGQQQGQDADRTSTRQVGNDATDPL